MFKFFGPDSECSPNRGRWGYFGSGASSDQSLPVLFLQHHVTYSSHRNLLFQSPYWLGTKIKYSFLLNFIFTIFNKKVKSDETKS